MMNNLQRQRKMKTDLSWLKLLIALIIIHREFKSADGNALGQLVTKLTQTCTSDVSRYKADLVNKTKCPVDYNFICWPQTEAGANATELCPSMLYYPNKNVTRRCNSNGTWEAISLATECSALPMNISNQNLLNLIMAYNISLVAPTTPAPATTATPSIVMQLMFKLIQSCLTDPTKYKSSLANKTKCPVNYNFICWPETEAGDNATALCPGIFYYPNRNVTRQCLPNGLWVPMNISSKCTPLPAAILNSNFLLLLKMFNISIPTSSPPTKDPHTLKQIKIFVVMQWISFGIMVPSLMLLFIFPNLNDDKMNLHRCLVISFLFSVITFLPEYYFSLSVKNPRACNALWILNRLFAMCEVTWMFNEGIYLLKTIVFVFSQDSYMWLFFLTGWGFPVIFTLFVWTPVMATKIGKISTRCWTHDAQNNLMLIIYLPMTIMLAVNMLILIYVIGVVISKLKQNHSADFQSTRKATKGAIVLMPLLGAIYLMIFYAPTNIIWYNYFLVIAQPMQGILVCVVHVFLNKDIHSAMKNKWRKLTNSTNLFQSTLFSNVGGAIMKKKSPSSKSKRSSLAADHRKRSSKVAPSEAFEKAKVANPATNNNYNEKRVQFTIQETNNDTNSHAAGVLIL